VYVVYVGAAILSTVKLAAPLLPGLIAARPAPLLRTTLLSGSLVGIGLYYSFFNAGASELYFLWYGLAATAALAAIGWDQLIRSRVRMTRFNGRAVALGVALLLVAWSVDLPSHATTTPTGWWANLGHRTVNEPQYVALRWLAHNTSPNDVIAVDQRADKLHCYATAYSERRALDGCSLGVVPEGSFGPPEQIRPLLPSRIFEAYRERAALNDAIFAGDPNAARRAARAFGVRYVVVLPSRSARTSHVISKLAEVTQTVYRNSEVAILRIRTPHVY
jgi:hypothetical protein